MHGREPSNINLDIFVFSFVVCRASVRFTKLLTNGFRSSFEFPEVCYDLAISLRSCEFHAGFRWEVAKFVASEVRAIPCSWFGNITTNEFEQSEKNSSTKQCNFMTFSSEM